MLQILNSDIWVDEKAWAGPNGELLQVHNSIEFNPSLIRNDIHGMWRYLPFLPLENEGNKVSVQEGFTPICNLKYSDKKVRAKLEFLFPTGSYKDRGATFLLSKIKELGIKEIVEDSSGNAGCAIAAYSAIAQIKCKIVVPDSTSAAKIKQIASYGAEVIKVSGSRTDATHKALELAKSTYFASHSYNPWFFQGTMTFAFEVWEQGLLPEEIIFPTGNGTLLLGAYLGFKKLEEAGLINVLPKLSAAQADACAPLFAKWKEYEFPTPQETLAEGITVREPIRADEILNAIQKSEGKIYTVTEAEIKDSHQQLALQGIYSEFTSAVAHAAIKQSNSTDILIPITGSGLKNKC